LLLNETNISRKIEKGNIIAKTMQNYSLLPSIGVHGPSVGIIHYFPAVIVKEKKKNKKQKTKTKTKKKKEKEKNKNKNEKIYGRIVNFFLLLVVGSLVTVNCAAIGCQINETIRRRCRNIFVNWTNDLHREEMERSGRISAGRNPAYNSPRESSSPE